MDSCPYCRTSIMRNDRLVRAPRPTNGVPADFQMYRLRSESSDESGDTWDLRWDPISAPEQPRIVRRISRAQFQSMDATGLVDSDVRITAKAIASLLGESP
jgi:hypothetical protein